MPPSPKDEPQSPLDSLLEHASYAQANERFLDQVVDAAYAEKQVDGSPQIVRFLAPTLAAAAGIIVTLAVTGSEPESNVIAAEHATATEFADDTELMIAELGDIDQLLALDSSSDALLIEDDELEAFLF